MLHGKTTYYGNVNTIVRGFTIVNIPPWFVTTMFYHVTVVQNLLWYFYHGDLLRGKTMYHGNLNTIVTWFYHSRHNMVYYHGILPCYYDPKLTMVFLPW